MGASSKAFTFAIIRTPNSKDAQPVAWSIGESVSVVERDETSKGRIRDAVFSSFNVAR